MKLHFIYLLTRLSALTVLGLMFFTAGDVPSRESITVAGDNLFNYESKRETSKSGAITSADVKLMTEKINLGKSFLEQFWNKKFQENRIRYRSPRVVSYASAVKTPCGVIEQNNAAYCPQNNTIYYDAMFFTWLMKETGDALNSDGDMAVITALAHEWGHAVQAQTDSFQNVNVYNELGADCLAGAFARFAYQNGSLETGDVEESLVALAAAGDDVPWSSADAHGSSDDRVRSFRLGFSGGETSCGCFDK